jgi:ferric-dicitrate binding protein FerR (iron transport regulator)
VVSEFNRYNSEKIAVADPAAASMTITGTFRTGNVEAFIGTVQRIFQLHIARHGESIVISR